MGINLFNSNVQFDRHAKRYQPRHKIRLSLPHQWDILDGVNLGDLRVTDGTLEVFEEFSFNGSTVVGDTSATLTPSCIHDALYGLIKQSKVKILEKYRLRKSADRIYRALMDLHGATSWRSEVRYYGLRSFGWLFC